MIAKHPPESTPNRGYSYVGQESIGSISGYEKGVSEGKQVRDIKVCCPAKAIPAKYANGTK
jgi:hypothetical protein